MDMTAFQYSVNEVVCNWKREKYEIFVCKQVILGGVVLRQGNIARLCDHGLCDHAYMYVHVSVIYCKQQRYLFLV